MNYVLHVNRPIQMFYWTAFLPARNDLNIVPLCDTAMLHRYMLHTVTVNILIQIIIKESKIVEMTRKFQFDKYTFSRLTDNNILDFTRIYLDAFHINSFRKYDVKTKL